MKHSSVDKDILSVIILSSIAFILALLVPGNWVLIRIVTLPLVLVLPGYALTSALFTKQVLGIAERLLFSLGLSVVIVILSGLVLNWMPFGLRTSSWAVLLTGITLGACAAALLRRRGQGISNPGRLGIGNIGLTFGQTLLLGLAALIVCGAVAVSIVGAEQQPRPGFTQLWILPASGAANTKDTVRLGMSNMESKTMEYRLAVNVDGKVVKEWTSIDLNANQTWEDTLVLPQVTHKGTARVEAKLYRIDASAKVYRDVVFWIGT